MEIVRLTSADERSLVDINRLLAQLREVRFEREGSPEELRAIVGNPNVALIVAKESGTLIGIATLYMIVKFGKRSGYVEDVVVDNDHRGQGIGEKLMRVLIDTARSNGLDQLYLTSRPERVAAHKLYEKLGFKKKETDVVFKLGL